LKVWQGRGKRKRGERPSGKYQSEISEELHALTLEELDFISKDLEILKQE
jgi:hypothetical protein